MLQSHVPQVFLEPLLDRHRQHRAPILLALASSNGNLMPVEVEVLDPKLQTFLQPQPGSVEKRHDHPHRSLDILEDRADLFPAEDDRDPMRHLASRRRFDWTDVNVKDVPVQEQQGAQRLILRRRADVLAGGKPRQERRDLGSAHALGMPLVVEDDESVDPVVRSAASHVRCRSAARTNRGNGGWQ